MQILNNRHSAQVEQVLALGQRAGAVRVLVPMPPTPLSVPMPDLSAMWVTTARRARRRVMGHGYRTSRGPGRFPLHYEW